MLDVSDLFYDPRDPDVLSLEIMSRSKGRLATLVDSNLRDMSMCRVSVYDHLTEPRDVDKYAIQSLASIEGARLDTLPEGTWVLFYYWSEDQPTTLGCVTDEQGARNLMAYIREMAGHSSH